MSSIAHNSYIHAHLTDSRTGRISQEQARILTTQTLAVADSIRSSEKRTVRQTITTEKVSLPRSKKATGKKSGSTDDVYYQLAKAFGAISVAMGNAMGTQSGVFQEEQRDNTIMAKSMLVQQNNQISQQKQIDTQIQQMEAEEKKEKHDSFVLNIVSWVTMGVMMIAAPIAVAVAPMVASAAAAAGTAIGDAASTIGSAVTEGLSSLADSLGLSSDATTESFEMTNASAWATNAGGDTASGTLALDAFSAEGALPVDSVAAGSSSTATTSTDAASTITKAATESTTTGWDTAKSVLEFIGKKVLGMAMGGLMGSSSLVEGIWDKRLSSQNYHLADLQQQLGTAMANVGAFRGSYTANQMNIKRESSLLEREGQQAGDVVSTFADMMQTVRQSTNDIAYAA